MTAKTKAAATIANNPVNALFRLFNQKNEPIETMPSIAPRDWLPTAASAVSPMATVNAFRIKALVVTSCR